ncbi:NCAM1 protein, partial [Polypterus senegalus]|nr:NCAM1 protein [Polypterus senegalus]
MMDTSKYSFNSDKSELNIRGIEKSDEGNYTCVAVNTLGEASDKTWLNISVMPKVMLNETAVVIPGQNINISCKATGDPLPTIIFSRNGKTLKSDEKKNADGTTIASFPIKNMNPSDGGAYTCSATSPAGRDSKTIQVITIPSTPVNVMVIPGPASLKINFSGLLDGGAPIISYTLQWRHKGRNDWDSTTVKAAGEPDKPVFSSEGTVEGNSYNISFQQLEDGGVPIQHYIVRYHAVSGNEDVKELRLDPEAKFVILEDLEWNTEYEVEIRAVNNRGESKPSIYNFNMPQELKAVSQKKGLGIGGIVAIVMVILLVLLIAVDTACYYTNHCGMMMCIAVNVFGKRPPGAKQHDFEGSSRFTKYRELEKLEVKKGECYNQADRRKAMQREVQELRDELEQLDSQIALAQNEVLGTEKSVEDMWRQITESRKRSILLRSFAEQCIENRQKLSTYINKINNHSQVLEELARKAEVVLVFGKNHTEENLSIPSVGLEPQVLDLIRSHPPSHLLAALEHLALLRQEFLKQKTADIDVSRDIEKLRFRIESKHLQDVSNKHDFLPSVKLLLQEGWNNVHDKNMQLAAKHAHNRELLSILNSKKQEAFQQLSMDSEKAPEKLIFSAVALKREHQELLYFLNMKKKCLQKIKQLEGKLPASDLQALLDQVKAEDQELVTTLLPTVQRLSQQSSQCIEYGAEVKKAIVHWWEQPAQFALPEERRHGLTVQQWIERWSMAAKALQQSQRTLH